MPPRIYADNSARRTCEMCGEPLGKRNTGTLHTSKNYPECRTEYYRRRTQAIIDAKWATKPNRRINPCDVCGNPLRGDNTIGVCQQNIECRREYDRRMNKIHGKRWYQENRDARLALAKRLYDDGKHEPITYLVYSAGLDLWKIGFTSNITSRMSKIINACPDVIIVTTYPVGKELETYLHTALAAHCVAGEWFQLSGRSVVDELASGSSNLGRPFDYRPGTPRAHRGLTCARGMSPASAGALITSAGVRLSPGSTGEQIVEQKVGSGLASASHFA